MKRLFTLILVFSLVLCLVGCGNSKPNNESNNDNYNDYTSQENFNEPSGNEEAEIKNPEMTFSQVYNPNGFYTFTGIIHNPNNVAIDSSFDIVYYKDNVEVGRNSDAYASSIEPNSDYVVYSNYDVPNPEEVDRVELENMSSNETYYAPIHAKYTYVDNKDGKANFKFTFDKTYTVATVWFLLYNDNNKNDKLDNGELVVACMESKANGEENFEFETDVFGYEKYEVYYNAY